MGQSLSFRYVALIRVLWWNGVVMIFESTVDLIRAKYEHLRPLMHEKMRRLWAASETLALPRGTTVPLKF